MAPLWFTDIFYVTPGKEEQFKEQARITVEHTKSFPGAIEVFFFQAIPNPDTEDTPTFVVWAIWKDQASVDAYHASTQYLKTIGILFSQGIASKFPQSYQFPAPIAGFEKKIPAENGNEVEEGKREQA